MKKKLKEFANLLNGYAFKSKNYVSSGIRIMRIANVKEGYIGDEQPCYYPEDAHEKIEKYMLKAGDMLISLTGNVGRIGIMPVNMLPAALNQRVCCIRLKDDSVNKKYLFYFFQRKSFIQDCVKASKGVAQLNLSTKFLKEYSVPVPPLPEQERIVARIEELFSELDKAVETLKTTKQQLAVYRQAVLKEAFNITGDDVIDTNLNGILSVLTDYHANGSYESLKANVTLLDTPDYAIMVRSTNYENNDFSNDVKYISKHSYDFLKKSQLFGNEVLMGKIGNAGRVYYVKKLGKPMSLAMNMFAMRFDKTIESKYVYYYLISPIAKSDIKKYVKGVGTPTIDKKSVRSIRIKYPKSRELQQKIISEIESKLSVYEDIEKTVDTALQQAEAMRQSILKQAFEGRLI